jgi:hypothetical protein
MKSFLFITAFLCSFFTMGQTTIVADGFNNTSTLFATSGGNYYSGNSTSSDRLANSPYASEGTHAFGVTNGSAGLTSNVNINTLGYTSVTMSLRLAAFSIASSSNGLDSNDNVTIDISTDGGINWNSTLRVKGNINAYWAYSSGAGIATTVYDGDNSPIDFAPSSTAGNKITDGYSNLKITGLPTTSNLRFRITLINNNNAERWVIDDFKVQGIPVAPEINISKDTSSSDIPTGSSANASFNTVFASTEIGSDFTKTYYVENEGAVILNISSITIAGANPEDFSVSTLPSTILVGSTLINSIPFTITFTPSSSGIRTATISIINNDSDENPYTFDVEGNGTCILNDSSLSPSSASEGGTVTISSSLDLSIQNTVTLNGVSLPYTVVSSSQITIVIPPGSNSGDLVITNHQGCSTTNSFTVIKNVFSGCQGGSSSTPSELFISEITDASSGGLTYIELFNGTGSAKNLSNYSLAFYNNGSLTNNSLIALPNFSLADGEVYVVAVGTSATVCSGVFGANASLADFSTATGGVNFTVGGNDHIKLLNGATEVDQWGVYGSSTWADALGLGSSGANFRRLNTATIPSISYSNSDWTIVNWNTCSSNNYSDIGIYNLLEGTSPVVTIQPVYTPNCGTVTLNSQGIESFLGGSGLTFQWYVNAPGSSSWFALNNTGVYSGANTSTLFISSTSSLNNYQYYCRIKEGGSTCYTATNTIMIYDDVSTWNGFYWNNGTPTITKKAVINGDYNTATNGSFDCCSLLVNSSRTLTIASGMYINIDDNLINKGTINVEDSASIIQTNETNTNTGTGGIYSIQRSATANNLDYIYWSSPVEGFSVSNLPSSHRYSWGTTALNANGTEGNWILASGAMGTGVGYISRVTGSSSVAFNGNINNGSLSVGVSKGSDSGSINDNYNLIGNPYPSSIDVDAFLYENANPSGPNPVIEGSIRIWSHGTIPSNSFPSPFYQNFQNNYNPNDYIIVNGTGSSTGPASFDGKIASGQGFFVVKEEGASSAVVNFNNAMRNKNYDNSQFFKNNNATVSNTIEKHRIWLNLIAQNGNSSRTLIGYITGATLAKDVMFDAAIEPSSMYLYSLIGTQKQVVQGRPVPFDENDLVPIGVKILTVGNYTISIAGVDGLFTDSSQNIYLEDTVLNVIHNLKQAPYTFSSTIGEFNERFVLRYNNAVLSDSTFEDNNNFIIFATEKISIQSSKRIKAIIVYDMLGRIIYEESNIDSMTLLIEKIRPTKETLVVKATLEDESIINRKVIY